MIGTSGDDGAFILLAAAKLDAPLREYAQGWSEAKMEGDRSWNAATDEARRLRQLVVLAPQFSKTPGSP